jgi:uncharacterized iron-regulated membrane protein
MRRVDPALSRNAGLAAGALLASSATLLCCVLPAVCVSGVALWHGRSLPCPTEPDAARQCRRLRRISTALYGVALACLALGATFAFVLPGLLATKP